MSKGIFDSIKDMAFEHEDTAAPQKQPAAVPFVTYPIPASTWSKADGVITSNTSTTVDTAEVEGIYSALKSVTDPASSPTLKQLNMLSAPLENIIADKKLRMKAVMAQTGISAATIASAIDSLLNVLETESQKFTQGKAARSRDTDSHEVEAKQIEDQISQLQIKLQGLRANVQAAKQAIANKEAAFNSAYQRRKTELSQMKAEY